MEPRGSLPCSQDLSTGPHTEPLPPIYNILYHLQVLYRELGLTVSSLRSKHRHPTTSKDVLNQIKQDHPLPGLILKWRKLNAVVTKVASYLMVLLIEFNNSFVNLGAVFWYTYLHIRKKAQIILNIYCYTENIVYIGNRKPCFCADVCSCKLSKFMRHLLKLGYNYRHYSHCWLLDRLMSEYSPAQWFIRLLGASPCMSQISRTSQGILKL
jgi:hypothetical protein